MNLNHIRQKSNYSSIVQTKHRLMIDFFPLNHSSIAVSTQCVATFASTNNMFLINDIDKILSNIVQLGPNHRPEVRVRLPDIKRIDVSRQNLVQQEIKWDADKTTIILPGSREYRSSELTNRMKVDFLLHKTNRRYSSTNLLFIDTMNQIILEKLLKKEQENLSGSRVIICDRLSYNLLLKLRRQLNKNQLNDKQLSANLLYKSPFNYSAILLLPEVIELFERQKKPLLFRRKLEKTGATGYNFNYNLVRAVFPYLKMSDLTFLVAERGDLDFSSVNVQGNRDYLTIQLLHYFARSSELIEMKPICNLLGIPHQFYNNFLIVVSPDDINLDQKHANSNPLNKLNLGHLVFMAEHLISLSDRLRLNLISITHTQNDIHGQARVLSQYVGNKSLRLAKNHIQSARVIVLDRLHSLRTGLAHADRYGAFLEQEPVYRLHGGDIERLRITTQDKLDEKLQLVPLIGLLSSIIEYTINLKPANNRKGVNSADANNDHRKGSLGSGLAIQRHLNIVKITCDILNEGYLLITRLEASLLEIANDMASHYWSANQQSDKSELFMRQTGEKITRFGEAYKQLVGTAGKSIRPVDLFRTGYVLLDIIESYLSIASGKSKPTDNKWLDAINELRRSIVTGRNIKEAFKLRSIDSDEQKKSQQDIGIIMKDLESVSGKLLASQKLTPDLIQTMADFEANNLNMDTQFTTIKLSDRRSSASDALILVFIGPITSHEISLLKELEKKWKLDKKPVGDLFILASNLLKPDDIVRFLTTKDI